MKQRCQNLAESSQNHPRKASPLEPIDDLLTGSVRHQTVHEECRRELDLYRRPPILEKTQGKIL